MNNLGGERQLLIKILLRFPENFDNLFIILIVQKIKTESYYTVSLDMLILNIYIFCKKYNSFFKKNKVLTVLLVFIC